MKTNEAIGQKLIDLTGYQIVIPAGSDETVVELTAYELKEYLLTLGVELPVVEDSAPAAPKEILVGKTSRTSAALPENFEYVISETDGKAVILAACSYGYEKALADIAQWGGIPERIDLHANAADSFVESAAQMQKADDAVRTIYYNIFLFGDKDRNRPTTGGSFRLRAEMVADMFRAYCPDVLAFQEYRDNRTYPGNVVPTLYMAQKLAELGFVEANVDELVFATGDDRNDTPIFYNKNTVKPLDRGYLLYPRKMNENFEVDEENGTIPINNGDTKSLTWVVFETLATGKRFAVLSTHLMYPAADLGLTPVQHNAARVIDAGLALGIVREIKQMKNGIYADIPIVLGGDMNTFPDTDPMFVLRDGGMKMARDLAIATEGCIYDTYGGKGYCTYDYDKKVYTRIPVVAKTDTGYDHILFENAEKVTVRKYLTLTEKTTRIPSDHPVKLVDFSIND